MTSAIICAARQLSSEEHADERAGRAGPSRYGLGAGVLLGELGAVQVGVETLFGE